MEIIYVVSVISLVVLFMLVKKSEQKLNFLGNLGLGVVLILCYNVFECYILNFFKIKLTLINLGIVNFIIDVIILIYLIKKKEIQQYYTETKDLIFSFLIAVIVLGIGAINFGIPLNVKYETTDPAVHYRATVLFSKNDSLLNNVKDEIYNFRTFKIGAYVNSGMLMKICSNYVSEFEYYKIFILFDLFILFLTGYMLYFSFVKISKGKLNLVAFILSILCILGYPLNSMCFGFEYLNVSLLIVCTIINMVDYYKNREMNIKWCVLILFLLNFELFCTYYLFVPFMYSALFIYFCIDNYKKDKKLFSKKNILILIITLIIPFILGFAYHLKPDLYSKNTIIYDEGVVTSPVASVGGLVSRGYIYENLYTNIILLMPLALFVIFKERKLNFSTILFLFLLAYMGILFGGFFIQKVSTYYICKNYFPLWIILFYLNFKGLYYLYEKRIWIPYLVITWYIILLVPSFLLFDVDKTNNVLTDYSLKGFGEVYTVNHYLTNIANKDIYISEMELFKYVNENLDKNQKIEIIGTEQQILWAYPLLDYVNYDKEMEKYGHQEKLKYKYNNNNIIDNSNYIVCLYRSDFYKKCDKTVLDKMEVVYENSFGKILRK